MKNNKLMGARGLVKYYKKLSKKVEFQKMDRLTKEW